MKRQPLRRATRTSLKVVSRSFSVIAPLLEGPERYLLFYLLYFLAFKKIKKIGG